MSRKHNVIFSYDQIDVEEYSGNFRIDLLKVLLKIEGIDQNTFEWWVETTFSFVIVNDSIKVVPLMSIQVALEKLDSKMNFHIGVLRNYEGGNAVSLAKPTSKGQEGFRDDLDKAKKELLEEK